MSFPEYPEYKGSGVEWLGEVPEHWDLGRLKHLLRIRGGQDYKAVESDSEYDFPVIGSGGRFTYATDYLYDGESVLLGRKGTVDKPLYVSGKFWTVDTMFYTEVLENISGRYAYYAAITIPFALYSTNTALPSMSQFDLANHPLVLPSVREQYQIARFLDHETARIDALVGEQQRLIELLKEKRQAVISHAVTKGLDPDVPMKDSGVEWLGEVPAHWKISKLSHYADVLTGFPFLSSSFSHDDSHVRLLRGANVGVGVLRWSDTVYWELADDQSLSRYVMNEGQIVLGMDRPWITEGMRIARVKESDLPCLLLQRVAAITPRVKLNDDYMFHLLASDLFKTYVEPDLTGVSVPHISPEQILGFSVPIPSLSEQAKIADFINSELALMDRLFQEASGSIKLLQERRSALISAAVTGKIDVRHWRPPADESAYDPEVRAAGLETLS